MRTQQMSITVNTDGFETPFNERRRHPRNEISARARVRGVDAEGRGFEAEGDLKDISAGGLYIRLAEAVERSAVLLAEVALCPGPQRLAVRGRVSRVERLIDGRCGVAVSFDQHQFIAGQKFNGGTLLPLATE